MQLDTIMQEFEFHLQTCNYSPRTKKNYINHGKKFITYLSTHDIEILSKVSHVHIKSYIKTQLDIGLSASYMNGTLKCLRAFFKYCIEEEYIHINPCTNVKWIKEPKCLIHTFTDTEAIAMLKVFKGHSYMALRNKLIVTLLFDTGIRNQELCDITLLDIKDNTLVIHGKGNKERVVPISPILKTQMLRYERVRNIFTQDKLIVHNTYLLSQTGRPLTIEAVERVIRKCGLIANVRGDIRCSPHTIRHYYAQTMLKNGLDVYTLSRLLGHEDITITKRYLQSMHDEQILYLAMETSPLTMLRKTNR